MKVFLVVSLPVVLVLGIAIGRWTAPQAESGVAEGLASHEGSQRPARSVGRDEGEAPSRIRTRTTAGDEK